MKAAQPSTSNCSHFYKYSTCDHLEWLKIIILEHKLYLPTLDQLNDPEDGRPDLVPPSEEQWVKFLTLHNPCRLSPGQIRRAVHTKTPKNLLDEATQIFHRGMNPFGIYSMSKRYDNLHLWREYAAEHSGYCLEFLNAGPLFQYATEVRYQDSVQMDITDAEDRSWISCKRLRYSYEEEVRLVSTPKQGRSVTIDPAWLNRLIVGKNMLMVHEEQMRAWSHERKPPLVIVKAEYDAASGHFTLTE